MNAIRAVVVVTLLSSLVIATTSCSKCGGPAETPLPQTSTLTPPTPKKPLELLPLPQPPAVTIAPGSIPNIPKGPVAVVAARPQGVERSGARPAITFNKPLVALGDRDATKPPAATIEPAVDGEWKWIGSSSIEFAPAKDLPYATQFKVSVAAGLKAIDNEVLPAPYTFQFETTHPQLDSSNPQSGWKWLPPEGKISLEFNMPMASDFANHVTISADGKPVPYDVVAVVDVPAENAKKRKATPPPRSPYGRDTRYELKPKVKLGAGARVVVAVDATLRAAEGTITAPAKQVEMTVIGPMKFTGVRACESWREKCPYGPVVLQSTNEPDVESMKGRVRFDPPIAVDEDELGSFASVREGAYSTVSARYRPGSKYKIIVEDGVVDAIGQRAPKFTGTFKLDDVDPDLRVDSSLALIEKTDGEFADSYPVETVNVDSVQAIVTPLTPATMAPLMVDIRGYRGTSKSASLKSLPSTKIDLDTTAETNVAKRTPLKLASAFGAGAPKLFHVALSASEVRGEPSYVLGQITDLAAHAKLGATSGLVWVTSLSKGTSVAGASVTLYDVEGKELTTATTDADGIAKVKGMADLFPLLAAANDSKRRVQQGDSYYDEPEVLIAAEKDGDTGVSFSTWEGDIGPENASIPLDFDGDIPRVTGMLVAERGIYRPGDDVDVKGILRVRTRGALSLPKLDSALEVTLSARGKNITTQKVSLTKYGTFTAHFKIPEAGGLGWYEVDANATVDKHAIHMDAGFRVEEYRAPKFKVDVAAGAAADMSKTYVIAGDKIKANVDARYLFGGAMPGARVETTVTRETSWFSPEGFDKYVFGVNVWGYDDDTPSSSSDVFSRTTAKVGDDGTLSVDAGEAEAFAGRTTSYTIESDVEDVSRQRVANRAHVTVHPASVYAGVRFGVANMAGAIGEGFGQVGSPMRVELIGVDVDGKRAGGFPINVTIKRRDWKSIRKKDPDSGRFTTVSEPQETQVSTCTKPASPTSPAYCDVTPDKAGLYIVEAVATDTKGRKATTSMSTYVTGGGWVSWQQTDGQKLDLVADKKVYEPGQTAKVLVKSPWPDAEALITVEREGIITTRRMKVGAAAAVDVPIDETMVPDVFVSVVIVRGRVDEKTAKDQNGGASSKEIDAGRPQVRVGYVKLSVDEKRKRLNVAVDATTGAKNGTHRPAEKMKVKLDVKDSDGKGAQAEVALWAVDEAVLRLTDYSVPDPVKAIHPERGLSVRFGEPLIFLVKKQDYGEKGRPPGGDGGGGGGGFRSNFKTTAFFVPTIETDANGHAEVDVQLPDDLTTYRVMALAVTPSDRAGFGKTNIVVAKPLLALPALPRLARVGDKLSAGVIVHSQNGGDVKVRAQIDGLVVDGGAVEQTVRVEAGKAREVRFAMTAKDPGRARLRFEVTGGGERDGVEALMPVQLPMVIETVAAAGDTGDQREEGLAPPADVYAGVGGLDVTLASTALAGYQEALEQLVDYPYGCAEQLSSRLVPFLALRELEGAFGVPHKDSADSAREAKWLGLEPEPGKDVADPDAVAKKTVQQLVQLQDGDGGFRYWGSSSCADPWASSYATLALARAKELGYPVDADVVERGQKFLADKVAASSLPTCGYGGRVRKASGEERAFALFVLARTGKPKNTFIESVFRERGDMPLFAKAMLADASYVGKADKKRADTLMQEVMNGAKESAREVHFEETNGDRWSRYWSSDVRTSAIVLMTLVDGQPEHPFVQKISSYLGTARKGGRYRNTQEAAFALMALTEVVRAKEKDAPAFNATVSLGGKNVAEQKFAGRSLDIVAKHVAMSDLGAPGSKAAPLVFAKTGTGTLSYTAALRYAKKTMPTTALDAGIAVQRWFEPFMAPPGSGRALKVRAGELVRVRVRVATSQTRNFVAIDVPLPAGLGIVDESLASSGHHAAPKSNGGGDEGDGEYGGGDEGESGEGDGDGGEYMYTPFNNVELRDNRAVFFADELPPGVHTATVTARATTSGVFVLKPATAEAMYAPETSGRSDGGTFEVVAE